MVIPGIQSSLIDLGRVFSNGSDTGTGRCIFKLQKLCFELASTPVRVGFENSGECLSFSNHD
jgi:hypothetical protein